MIMWIAKRTSVTWPIALSLRPFKPARGDDAQDRQASARRFGWGRRTRTDALSDRLLTDIGLASRNEEGIRWEGGRRLIR